MKKLVRIPDLHSLWSYPENTRILLFSSQYYGPYCRIDWIQQDDQNKLVTLPAILCDHGTENNPIFEQLLVFTNGKIRPWWFGEDENDWKLYLEAYAVIEETEMNIYSILNDLQETNFISDEHLVFMIDFFEDLTRKIESMNDMRFSLFRLELLNRLESLKSFKAMREMRY